MAAKALPRDLASRLLDRDAELWNLYGPTETTIWSTAGRVSAGRTTVRLGDPLSRTRLYVLDKRMDPVPYGVAGELYIGGIGLARGYLFRPGLTAERFVPDPFAAKPGARLYRTGDLVRTHPDKGLEFIGRLDHQVKIRGHRIELGEIESALVKHPGISQAVVDTRDDLTDGKSLAAYIIVRSSPPPSAAELRNFLKESLPDYMIPSTFSVMEAMPLTLNGKLDRSALHNLDDPRPDRQTSAAVVQGATQEVIAAVWEAVLRRSPIGADQSFFELGGHSLLATQVMSRLRDAFGIPIPLRVLFERRTVAALAQRIDSLRMVVRGTAEVALHRIVQEGPRRLSFAQESLWFLDRLDPGRSTFNMYSAVRIRGPLNIPALRNSVNELIRRHESLRTTFRMIDGAPQQCVASELEIDVPLIDLENIPAEERLAGSRRAVRRVGAPAVLPDRRTARTACSPSAGQ